MFVVKVLCGLEQPSIPPPFAEIGQALRWITDQAWLEFDGDAERAEIFECDGRTRRLALHVARGGGGRLVTTVRRPLSPNDRRRRARIGSPK